jgi:hypothetical protein
MGSDRFMLVIGCTKKGMGKEYSGRSEGGKGIEEWKTRSEGEENVEK